MTRLARFVANIFQTFFHAVIEGGKSAFSIIVDWESVALAHGYEVFFDIISAGLLTHTLKVVDKVAVQTGLSAEEAARLKDLVKAEGEAGALVGQVGLSSTTGGLISSILGPWLKLVEYNGNRNAIQQRFDPKTALAIKFRRGRPGRATEAHVRDLINRDLKDQGWSEERSELLEDVAHSRLKEDLLCTLRYRGLISHQDFTDRMYFLGYDFNEAEDYLASMASYPGISDIVRMAVREAYTPEIAEKFGQYQDLPAQFVTEAAKVGISEEIARQFWAAHWDLPSPNMGFEMLHRGIINQDDLKLLLRALDIMPYWRDRMIQLSYSPFTRVDIRRMHKLGILNEAQVNRAYRDIGYAPEKADALTRFTLALNADTATQTEKDLTKAEMVAAFKKRIISEGELRAWLQGSGYNDAEISVIVDSSRTAADIVTRELTLSQIKDLYQKGLRTRTQITPFLTAMGFKAEPIIALYDLWDWEKPATGRLPTRTDFDKWISLGLIGVDSWSEGYSLLGYDMVYQELYFAALVETGKVDGGQS